MLLAAHTSRLLSGTGPPRASCTPSTCLHSTLPSPKRSQYITKTELRSQRGKGGGEPMALEATALGGGLDPPLAGFK